MGVVGGGSRKWHAGKQLEMTRLEGNRGVCEDGVMGRKRCVGIEGLLCGFGRFSGFLDCALCHVDCAVYPL